MQLSLFVSARPVALAAFMALSVCLSGCGAWQSVSDTSGKVYHGVFYKQVKILNVDLTARAAINPDEANRPCSVVVRVYQLKDRKAFDAASYSDLLKNDRVALAKDLLATRGVVVDPGGAANVTQAMDPATQYVAVVAFYRETGNDEGWRQVIEKKSLSADKPLTLGLSEHRLVMPTDPAP